MDFSPEKEITNATLVTDHFGYWPTFHDAEIMFVTLSRSLDISSSSILVKVYAFETTSKVTEDGYYETIKHCIIDFEFTELAKNEIDGFNHQNAVLNIEFGREDEFLDCNIVNSVGISAYIQSKKINVSKLEVIESPL